MQSLFKWIVFELKLSTDKIHHTSLEIYKPSLKKLILQKLVRGNVWGVKHTPFDFVKKGVPEHYRNAQYPNGVILFFITSSINNFSFYVFTS